MSPVYLDHNATTPLRSEVREHWLGTLDALAGNPSSLHAAGRAARHVLDAARERAAAALGVHEEELVFTSGGTEANNLAVLGAVRAGTGPARVVTTAIEHSSVLGPARRAEREGHELRVVGVDAEGLPDLERIAAEALGAPRAVVAVMAANNEIGTCPPIGELARDLSATRPGRGGARVVLATDAVQALGRIPVPLHGWGVDLAAFSAHKLGGPVGSGLLYRRRGVALEPLFYGGGQEEGLRPGTEAAAAASATALAIELAIAERESYARHAHACARALWDGVRESGLGFRLLGPPLATDDAFERTASDGPPTRLPGTINLLAPDLDGKVLVTRLDLAGLQVSAGSACASGSLEPSHVLLAMGMDEDRARAGLRFSIGRETTLGDVRQAVDILRKTLR